MWEKDSMKSEKRLGKTRKSKGRSGTQKPGFQEDSFAYPVKKRLKWRTATWQKSAAFVGMILTSCFLMSTSAKAEINPNQAVLAIAGEAENQGFKGMTAVAEAIRNRGNLKGVYGLKSPRLKKAEKWVFVMARKAWETSESSNLTKGADGWGTDSDIQKFKKEGWWKPSLVTVKIGAHTFYKGKVNV